MRLKNIVISGAIASSLIIASNVMSAEGGDYSIIRLL